MIELKINCENEEIKNAFINFVLNYKTNISDYMNQMVANDGGPCDSEVVYQDNQLTIYHIAPDKGFVIGETGDENVPVQIMQYSALPVAKRYILPERDKLVLFFKEDSGTADVRLGAFKTLGDTIKGFNSEPVKLELERLDEMKKAKKREEDRKLTIEERKKLGKNIVEDAQVVENTNE